MKRRLILPAVLTLIAQGGFAQSTTAEPLMEMKNTGTPGQALAMRSMTITATVKAVDVANRTVTLQRTGREAQTFRVGPEVTRLNEVAVGDTVVVDYQEGLMLELQAAGAEPVSPQGVAVAERNASSQAPGGSASAGVRGTVTVTAIDMTARTVVFRRPNGDLYQVRAGPNIHLEKLKVGDKLTATYVQAVAINLSKPPKK
jgi:hypothetical protein